MPDPLDTLGDRAARLDAALSALPPDALDARLDAVARAAPGPAVFTTSLGLEDQALTHAIRAGGHPIRLVTLDTGRLFPETYALWAETEARYGALPALVPDGPATERLLAEQGAFGFRDSVANRHACCGLRKVEPLGRALAGAGAWITGLRAEQSANRARTPFAEVDAARNLLKVSPLADWDRDRLAAYVAANRVPVNPLHARGFPSIGCAPCTRAVRPGEPERAGRWWWEAEEKRECGLHDRPGAPRPPFAERQALADQTH
jgi:phosphoadenosine phosphosulfate reductase